jgi:hypothetical protein
MDLLPQLETLNPMRDFMLECVPIPFDMGVHKELKGQRDWCLISEIPSMCHEENVFHRSVMGCFISYTLL